jgi:hypothetical protein
MGITAIKSFNNKTTGIVNVRNVERSQEWLVDAGKNLGVDIWIPWCVSQVDFDNNHYMMIIVQQYRNRTYWIWQSNEGDGDHVRYNTQGSWKPEAAWVDGFSGVNGDRAVEIRGDGSLYFLKLGG